MGLIQLVLTVCALAQPSVCEERRLTYSIESGSLFGCMMQAQPMIAQWAGEHPSLRVTRWRCVLPEAEGKKI
ncbi:MAG TPA: hypothetical protein VK446_05595 [Methylocystis sp.]|nr:hypothetical protein [Methylocystis sp.]